MHVLSYVFERIFRYFVVNHRGNVNTKWWNTKWWQRAGHIDFTNSEATKWYTNRLERLRDEAGIDGFKFDAGETSWTPPVKHLI